MKMFWALQVLDTYATQEAAQEALQAQQIQLGHLAGRVYFRLKDKAPMGEWVMQSFHEDAGPNVVLPEGMLRVLVQPSWIEAMDPNANLKGGGS